MRWRRELIGFAVLFIAYQAPEGIGQRLFHSFAIQAGLLLLFFPVAFIVGRWLRGSAGSAYALEWSPANGLLLAALFVVAIATKATAVAIGAALGVYAIAPATVPAAALVSGVGGAAVMTFFPSIAEDIVTRGFWFRIGLRWRPATFVLASSGIYVANHVFRLALGPLEWLMIFAFGCAYAAAVVKGGTLWAAVGLHWGWNFANAAQDSVATVTTLSADGGRLVSAVAHLGLLAIIWLWPRRPAEFV